MRTTFKELVNTTYRQILFFLGSALCLWIFYVRIIMERAPRDVTFTCKYCLGFYFLAMIFFGYLLSKEIYRYINKTYKYKPISNKMFITFQEKFLHPISNAYNTSLELVHTFFIDIHGGIIKDGLHHSLFKINSITEKPFWDNPTLHRWLYISILILPRVVVITCLIVDTVIFHRFFYVYKFLWVLLIPLSWKILFYCLEKHLTLQKLFTTIFFEIHVIRDIEEVKLRCPDLTPPVYEFIDRTVPEEVLSHYPFISTAKDYENLRNDYVIFDAVESNFIKIMSSGGPVPLWSSEYNKVMLLSHLLSLYLWSYMFCMTLVTPWI